MRLAATVLLVLHTRIISARTATKTKAGEGDQPGGVCSVGWNNGDDRSRELVSWFDTDVVPEGVLTTVLVQHRLPGDHGALMFVVPTVCRKWRTVCHPPQVAARAVTAPTTACLYDAV